LKQNILIKETKALPRVKQFLTPIEQNSRPSAELYTIGLSYLNTFLSSKGLNLETILEPLKAKTMDLYSLLQDYVNYLTIQGNGTGKKLSPRTIRTYLAGPRSYLGFNGIFVIPQEYRYRVKEPKIHTSYEEPLDEGEVRKILVACSNKRLKAYLLIFATGGPRAKETLSIRLRDIDFDSEPTRINLRSVFTKTRTERYFFISDEATKYLKEWIDYKYRPREKEKHTIIKNENDLVFAVYDNRNPKPKGMYEALIGEFNEVLKTLGMDERKDGMLRRKITFHSFRRFVYSQVSDIDNQFAEFLLGHKHSTYWGKKPERLREKYLECMKYLRFLNIDEINKKLKDTDQRLEQDANEISSLKKQLETLGRQLAELKQTSLTTKEFWMLKHSDEMVREMFGDEVIDKIGNRNIDQWLHEASKDDIKKMKKAANKLLEKGDPWEEKDKVMDEATKFRKDLEEAIRDPETRAVEYDHKKRTINFYKE